MESCVLGMCYAKLLRQLSWLSLNVKSTAHVHVCPQPMESESVNVSTTQPPPSILKVKQPSGGVRSDGVRSEGVRGDEEEEEKSTPAPITRKIRSFSCVHKSVCKYIA